MSTDDTQTPMMVSSARVWTSNRACGDRPSTVPTLHGLFETQAIATPDGVALISGGQQITYRQLDERATIVADTLRRLGVQPETLVGLCVERSPELVSGILGILKAGGAYVPLDPSHPIQRLELILADSGVSIVLTHSALVDRLAASAATIICLDRLEPMLPSVVAPTCGASPSDANLAYVMYTSGSTGQPKGVMIEHGAVVNTVLDVNRRFNVNASDRVLGLASFGFDLSVYDIFGILAVGGALVLPDERLAQQPAHWAELLERHQITLWNSVPASLEMLASYAAGRAPRAADSLRLVLLAGDWISLSLPGRLRSLNPRAQIISLGGATEASIWSFLYPIGAIDPAWNSIPYGLPMDGQSYRILDEHLRPCPPGEAGQLFIGGVGIARGYFNRPELTAAKFIVDPCAGPDPAARLFATGDRARLLGDGTIEFLGRMDNQIKIRGYRVELGEIEAALARHPGVREAVVVAQQQAAGRKVLLAYVVAADASTADPENWQSFLRRTLPDYMVPARWVLLDRLPLSANGKIDRGALGASALQRPATGDCEASCCEPAASDVERRLVAIWQRTFDRRTIGVEESFFDLGGDSLLAVDLCIRIEAEFGQRMAFDVLLEAPTIRALALLLGRAEQSGSSMLVPLRADGSRRPLFCLPGIGGCLIEFQALAESLGPDQPVYGLRPRGSDGREPPHTSIAQWAADNIAALRSLQPEGPYCLVGFSLGGIVAFEMARQLEALGQTVGLIALVDAQMWGASGRLSLAQRLRQHAWKFWHNDEGGRGRFLAARFRLLVARLRRRDLSSQPDDLVLTLDCPPQLREMAKVHLAALQEYRPGIYRGPMTLFTAGAGPTQAGGDPTDPMLGWKRWVEGHIDAHNIPATHTQMLSLPHARTLATKLLAGLNRVAADPATGGNSR